MDRLQALYDENPGITGRQLYIKSLRAGLDVSKTVVNDFVNRQGDKQIFCTAKNA